MNNRKILLRLLTLIMVLTLTIPQISFAASDDTGNGYVADGVIESEIQSEPYIGPVTRIPNIIKVSVTKRDANKVRINALNVGVETFDSVSCNVKITNTSGLVQYNKKITFSNLFPLFSQYIDLSVKDWSIVEVTNIYCQDGSDSGYLADFVRYAN